MERGPELASGTSVLDLSRPAVRTANAPAAGTVMLTYRGKHYGQHKAVAITPIVLAYRGARFEK